MMRRPEPPPPIDDPLTIIRQGINAALRVLVVGKSVSAFDAQRRLYAALRAVETLEARMRDEGGRMKKND